MKILMDEISTMNSIKEDTIFEVDFEQVQKCTSPDIIFEFEVRYRESVSKVYRGYSQFEQLLRTVGIYYFLDNQRLYT